MISPLKQLSIEFYSESALVVAPKLLGKIFHYQGISLIISETEAYVESDSACHAHNGKTLRNAPMFESGGILYVYLCYGIHHLCNIVVDAKGTASAVLLRAGLVHTGHDKVKQRRGGRLDLVGPGKFGQALGLTTTDSGRSVVTDIRITEGYTPITIRTAKRVGIDYAKPKDRDAQWRFIAEGFENLTKQSKEQ